MTTKTISVVIKGDTAGGEKVKKNLDSINDSFKKTQTASENLKSSFFSLKNVMIGLAGSFAVREFITMSDNYINLTARIKNATRGIDEFKEAYAGLKQISMETGSELKTSVDVFQRLSFIRDELKATNSDMVNFTSTVSKLGVVSGTGSENLKAGLLQLGQAMSSGILRAEEFNSINENIPIIGTKIAEQFGITGGQLRQLVVDGRVASEDVFKAMLNITEETNQEFSEMPMTIGRAFSQLKNDVSNFIGQSSEASGAVISIVGVVDLLRISLNGVSLFFNGIVTAIGTGAAYIFTQVENLANKTINLLNKVSSMANKIPGVNIGKIENISTSGLSGGDILKAGAEDFSKIYDEALKNSPANTVLDTIFAPKENFSSKNDTIRNFSKDYKKEAEKLKKDKDLLKEAEKQAEAIKKTTDELKFNNEQLGRSKELQEVYNNLRSAGVGIDSQAGQNIRILTEEHQRLIKEQETMTSIVNGLEGGFKNLFTNAISGAKSWRDSMRGILNDVSGMFYDLMIKDNVKSLLGSAIGGSSGGSGILGSVFGGLGKMLGFASGGSFNVGGTGGTDSQLVAFRASPNETVSIGTPAQTRANSGGGSTIVYNIDARGADVGVVERIEQSLNQLNMSVERRAMAAVQQQMTRDPNYGRR